MRRLLVPLASFAALIAAGCNGDDTKTDAGNRPAIMDAGPINRDSGVHIVDGGTAGDAGGHPDGQVMDAGFTDPDTLLEGRHDINGLLTYVRVLGTFTSTMPPAVVLHSGPAISHEYLLPHMKVLMEGRTLIFYDMRATGLTSFGDGTGTSTITAAEHAEELRELLDYLNQYTDTSRVDVVGHGYGAGIATLFTAANNSRVSRLILLTPYPANNAERLERIQEQNRRLTGADRQQLSAIMNRRECLRDISLCFLQLWAVYGPHEMCSDNRDRFQQLNFLHGSFRAQVFVDTQLRDSNYDWRPQMQAITVPTTVISGDCDPIPVATGATYASEIPNAVHHTLSDSGHFPMVESPERFNFLLRRALTYP